MKKEYIKPTSEAVNLFTESLMMGTSGELKINSDDTEAIDDVNQMKSNHQGIGKGLWD
mgnify:CR=1